MVNITHLFNFILIEKYEMLLHFIKLREKGVDNQLIVLRT